MPRIATPEGYLTSSQAAEILNCSVTMVYSYEKSGQLHKTVPPGRRQGFFLEKEVRALSEGLSSFFHSTINPTETEKDDLVFCQATPDDMEGVYKVAASLFGSTTSAEARKPLIEACPVGNYVVKRNGQVVAFIHIQPLKHETLLSFMKGDIRGKDITVNNLDTLVPGKKVECLIKSIGGTKLIGNTDKDRKANQLRFIIKLMRGTASELAKLGSQGIIIDKVYATSETPTGIAMGFSANMDMYGKPIGEGRFRFVLDVEESDTPFLRPYKQGLKVWRSKQSKKEK